MKPLLLMDANFQSVSILDLYTSLLWVERYCAYGDFELYLPADTQVLSLIERDFYIWREDADDVMIIEDIAISADVENGNHLTLTGRSLESILDRRIIWNQTVLSGNFQNAILKVLNENVINPSIADRKIQNFVFIPSTDPYITSLTIEAQTRGDTVYDVVQILCDTYELGFKITLSADNVFEFRLVNGANRSYSQTENPHVIFSPKFENIINSNYLESGRLLKTVALVGGEGEGYARKVLAVNSFAGAGTGLDRRETFTDASGISSSYNGGTLSPAQYNNQLKQAGLEDLSERTVARSFEGQVDATRMFVYGVDFFVGDIVQVVNEYGMSAMSRIMEVIYSHSTTGEEIYPTFSQFTEIDIGGTE